MTKQEQIDKIKKSLAVCVGASCEGCEYHDDLTCGHTLKTDARELIIEQEKEIERLKAENEKYLDSIESVQAGRCRLRCQLTEQAVKQAKIEVLNKLKSFSIYDDNYLDGYVFIDDIDKLLEEYENDT